MLSGLRRAVTWLLRGFLLAVLTVLALMNADPVTLKVFGQHWQVPLPLALFGAIVFGVVLAGVAVLERYLALRREIAALKSELRFRDAAPRTRPPPLGPEADTNRAMER